VIDKEEIIVFPKGTLLKQIREVKHLQIRMHYSGVQKDNVLLVIIMSLFKVLKQS
jgi:hypothetical protein